MDTCQCIPAGNMRGASLCLHFDGEGGQPPAPAYPTPVCFSGHFPGVEFPGRLHAVFTISYTKIGEIRATAA